MTTLAQGSSATVSVGDGGYVTFATNGGFGSATITPTTGAASSVPFGPWAHRQKLGPFSEGASVALVNTSCGAFDYDFDVGNSSAVAALVSTPGNPSQPGPAVSFFSATGGLWSGLVADGVPAPWATALFARLWSSVVSDYGPQPTFARDADYSTLPMVTDDQGMLRDTLAGEAMFHGARRERQLCRYPEQLSFSGSSGWTPESSLTVASAWDDAAPTADGLGTEGGTVWLLTAAASTNSALAAQAGVVYEAVPHVFAVWMKADSAHNAEIEIAIAAGATLATKVVAVTTAWQLFYVPGTPDGSSAYVYRIAPMTKASAAGGAVYVRHPRMHQRVGVTTAPPEFVPRDSYPRTKYWEGAAVDGVKYFHTINAATLNSGTGVVTPVAGSSLAVVPSVSGDLSTWTKSGVGATGAADADGWVKVSEDASTAAAHQINISVSSSAVYDKRRLMLEAEVKQAGGSDRAWVRLFIQDLDGSSGKSAYFDLVNGVFGTVSSGIFPVAEALSGGGYRVSVSQQLGTGASNAVVRIYSITADNTPTHNGDTTKGVLVRNARTVLRTVRGVDLFPTAAQLVDTRFSSWTLTGLGSITAVTGPDGKASAVKIVEDTTTGAHHISTSLIGSSTYDGKWVVASVYAKQAGGSDRAWIRLFIQDVDGATGKSVYFNVTTGQIGTATAGCLADVEPIGDGWFRCHFAVLLGTGASNAVMRIYSVTADNTPTHTGTVANGVHLFLPNATSAISSASTADKAVCLPPVANASASAITLPGSHMSYPVSGHLGRSDFGVSSVYAPYYKPTRANKGGESASAYSCTTYVRCEGAPDSLSAFGDFDTCRTGLTIRPNSQGSAHYGKWAWDGYMGNPNAAFMWTALTAYALGDLAIRTTTLPNNSTGLKVFTCVVSGISGASEPTWNSTFTTPADTTSNLTTDGTVRWQCNEDNGISGNWEPYLGAQLTPAYDTFMAEQRNAWFLTGSTYGCWNNGAAHVKQTQHNLDNGLLPVLPFRPKTLWLAQFGSNKGVPGSKQAGVADAELMSSYRAFVRDVQVWHTAPAEATISATAALV